MRISNQDSKEKIFSILKWFAEFCDNNNLRYYLAYGTLLGAIRHKDFIPWDDDVDVYMPRPDYEKFIECFAKQYNDSKYELRSRLNNKVNLPFEKIVDMTTTVRSNMNDVDDHLWIDIFPLDGLSSSEKSAIDLQKKANRCLRNYGYASAKIGSGTTTFKAFFKIPVILPFHLLGPNHYTKELKKLASSYEYEKSEYVGNIVWGAGEKDIFLKTDFDDPVEVEFHGLRLHAMRDWDKYLKKIYGDYMVLPPESARIGHCFEAYDLNIGD